MKTKLALAVLILSTNHVNAAVCPVSANGTLNCPITTPPPVAEGNSFQWRDMSATSFTRPCTMDSNYFVNANLDDLVSAAGINVPGCDFTNAHSRYKINWVKANLQGATLTGFDLPVADMTKSNSSGSKGGAELYYYTTKVAVIERAASKPFSAHIYNNYDRAILTGSDWSNNYLNGVYFGPLSKLPSVLTDSNIINTTFACSDWTGVAADANYNHVRITSNAFEIYRVNGVARSYILKGVKAQPKSIEDSVVVTPDGVYHRLFKMPNLPGWSWSSRPTTDFDQIPVKSLHPVLPTTATAVVAY